MWRSALAADHLGRDFTLDKRPQKPKLCSTVRRTPKNESTQHRNKLKSHRAHVMGSQKTVRRAGCKKFHRKSNLGTRFFKVTEMARKRPEIGKSGVGAITLNPSFVVGVLTLSRRRTSTGGTLKMQRYTDCARHVGFPRSAYRCIDGYC